MRLDQELIVALWGGRLLGTLMFCFTDEVNAFSFLGALLANTILDSFLLAYAL